MSFMSLGDMAQVFQSRQNTLQLRTQLNTLTKELSLGKVADLTDHLRGDSTLFRDTARQLSLNEAKLQNAQAAADRLDFMQLGLEQVDTQRRALIDTLVTLNDQSTADQLGTAAGTAREAFNAITAALNAEQAGRSLFAGRATDGPALAPAEAMLTDLRTAIAGAGTVVDVITALDAWFDSPGGDFETSGYQGDDAGNIALRLDEGTTVTVTARADDAALRQTLKGAAMAALAMDTGTTLSTRERAALMQEANIRLFSNSQPLTQLRAALGQQQGQVEEVSTRLTSQVAALTLMRNDLERADPFATAGALQEVQVQLETHYSITARLSRLSLAEYLR